MCKVLQVKMDVYVKNVTVCLSCFSTQMFPLIFPSRILVELRKKNSSGDYFILYLHVHWLDHVFFIGHDISVVLALWLLLHWHWLSMMMSYGFNPSCHWFKPQAGLKFLHDNQFLDIVYYGHSSLTINSEQIVWNK